MTSNTITEMSRTKRQSIEGMRLAVQFADWVAGVQEYLCAEHVSEPHGAACAGDALTAALSAPLDYYFRPGQVDEAVRSLVACLVANVVDSHAGFGD